ncbi:DUF932 domain-containing protein [Phycisphaerae bacterium]|nr:DUF932 domain-containing protein [Phycisphaerae bacterium]
MSKNEYHMNLQQSHIPFSMPQLNYVTSKIGALQIAPGVDVLPSLPRQTENAFLPRRGITPVTNRLRFAPRRLLLDGEPVIASDRFWASLFHKCGFNDVVFKYFKPDEVFQRISQKDTNAKLRFTVEQTENNQRRLLGVASSNTPIVGRDSALALLRAHGGEKLSYADGRLTSTHMPAGGPGHFRIGPDDFEHRFTLDTPLDGFGEPKIWVTLLRMICTNGAIGMQRAFCNPVKLGQEPLHALDRALSSYANADGFSAMRQRFESAQKSWASLEDVRSLERIMTTVTWGGGDAAGSRRNAFERMVGDIPGIYGVASLEGISPKRRRLLPSRARVYDLINFASEVSTHHAMPLAASKISAWIGTTIVDEFDLEGSAKEVNDFEALFLDQPRSSARGTVIAKDTYQSSRGLTSSN